MLQPERPEPSDPDAAAEFRIDVAPERDAVRVCPIGDLDISTVDEVRAQLEHLVRDGYTRLILDLRGTTFLDSTGLRLALDAHKAAAQDGIEFAIIGGDGPVQHAFEVAGLSTRLPFVDPPARS